MRPQREAADILPIWANRTFDKLAPALVLGSSRKQVLGKKSFDNVSLILLQYICN